jgi:hypothetical protein
VKPLPAVGGCAVVVPDVFAHAPVGISYMHVDFNCPLARNGKADPPTVSKSRIIMWLPNQVNNLAALHRHLADFVRRFDVDCSGHVPWHLSAIFTPYRIDSGPDPLHLKKNNIIIVLRSFFPLASPLLNVLRGLVDLL